MICQICGNELKSFGMPAHLKRTHKIEPKDYYDKYIEPGVEHKCVCGNDTSFISLASGYRQFCCQNCARRNTLEKTKEKYGVTNISQVKEINTKMRTSIKKNWANLSDKDYNDRCNAISKGTTKHMKAAIDRIYQDRQNFAKEHNLVELSDLILKYGTGFIQSSKFKKINVIKYKNKSYISQDDIHYFDEYVTAEKTNAMKNTITQNKVKQTNLAKYGAENIFASEYGKQKSKQTKLERYNDANYNNRVKSSQTCLDKYGKSSYVETDDFRQKVLQNQKNLYERTNTRSKIECNIINILKSYTTDIISNYNIGNYVLDIYIPSHKVAIEYNSIWWHSIEAGKSIDYHLKKSLACKELGIRLIHIYEFEDFNTQIDLLVDLLHGKDNYPKDDFNKNNLIDDIPKPEIIYKNSKYTVYGAGKLY